MLNDILIALVFSLGFNVLMFIPAFIYKTDKLTDISYALTFIALIVFSFIRSDQEFGHTVLLIIVFTWALRLGSFLFIRINRMGKDKRFDGMREYFFKFLRFWLLQAVTVAVVLLPSIIYMKANDVSLAWSSYLGLFIFILGLIIEAVADQQKSKFSSNPDNKDKWINTGIWKYSRHPNYLGEMMVWSGIYIYTITSLSVYGKLVGLVSPLFIILLLLFVSGVPLLEKAADKKWGHNKDYQAYKNRTPVLIPFLHKN